MFGNTISKNKEENKKMNPHYYINVADYMPEELPRPSRKKLRDEDGVEIPIISITCGVEV